MKIFGLFLIIAISLSGCGKDSATPSPTDPVDKDLGNDVEFSKIYVLTDKKEQTRYVTGNFNCFNPNLHKKKLTPQQRAQIFQRLCQRATRMSENSLNQKCRDLSGTLEDVKLHSQTNFGNQGHCRFLTCSVEASGNCGVNE